MGSSSVSADLSSVLAALEDETGRLAGVAAAAIFNELPGYADVPPDAILRSMRSNVSRAVETLRSGEPPAPSTRAEAAAITRERAEQGVPIDDIIRAYRLALRVIHDRFMTLASVADVEPVVVLECSNLLWQVGDWFTAIAAVEFRNHRLEADVQKSVHRSELLRDLVGGLLDESALHRAATGLQLSTSRSYAVFCMATRPGEPVLERSRDPIAEIAGRIYGVLPAGDAGRFPDGARVAVGPARHLAQLQDSARLASRIADLIGGGPAGVYRVEDLPWSLAVHSEPEVAAHLHSKYIAPLQTGDAFGTALLESVRAYLAADLSVTVAARELVVHPNTLRYRLARYESIVGVRLGGTRSIVELAMALDVRLPSSEPP
jgi:putative transposase